MQADAPNAVTDESDSLGRARDLGGILLWQARENVKVCVCVCVCEFTVVGGWRMAECSEVRGSIHTAGVFFWEAWFRPGGLWGICLHPEE